MTLEVLCNLCGKTQIDYDAEFVVRYEQTGGQMLRGVGRRLDVCRACQPQLEFAISELEKQQGRRR